MGVQRTALRLTHPIRPSRVFTRRKEFLPGSSSCTIKSKSTAPITVLLPGYSRTAASDFVGGKDANGQVHVL